MIDDRDLEAVKAAETIPRFTALAIDAMKRHARDAYPHECCGALIGRDSTVAFAFALPNNTTDGPRTRFLVTPDDYRKAETKAAEAGAELLGFYHSHPDHPPRPSRYDLEHAWPNFIYPVLAVTSSAVSAIRCWRLAEDRGTLIETGMRSDEDVDE